MGCDIHAYVEERRINHPNQYWRRYGEADIMRDYRLFSLMAGVRSKEGRPGAIVEPRGLPDNIATMTEYEAYMFIVDEVKMDGDSSRYVLRSDAKRWVREGHSVQVDEFCVTDPDWHTHSWLSIPELREVIRQYEGDEREHDAPNDIRAALASMLMLCDGDEDNARIVFWFDN